MRKKSGKGRTISTAKKANIKRNKLVKAGKMKPPGSKPRFVEGGHLKARSEDRKLKKKAAKTMSKLEAEEKQLQKQELERQQSARVSVLCNSLWWSNFVKPIIFLGRGSFGRNGRDDGL